MHFKEGETGLNRTSDDINMASHLLSICSTVLQTISNIYIASSRYGEGAQTQHAFSEIFHIGSKALEQEFYLLACPHICCLS